MPPSERRLEKIKAVAAKRQKDFILVLEDIHDPHNAAAILRTCDAFGIQEVWFVFDREKSYRPCHVGRKSSSSANKWLDFKVFSSTDACLTALKKGGYAVFATALTKGSKDVFGAKLTDKKVALAMGNEHRGLSEKLIAAATRVVYIPMRGMVQSLNVSVSAGIFVSEIARQRSRNPKKYRLSKKEAEKLAKKFAEK